MMGQQRDPQGRRGNFLPATYGWIRSGDVARMVSTGGLYVTSRSRVGPMDEVAYGIKVSRSIESSQRRKCTVSFACRIPYNMRRLPFLSSSLEAENLILQSRHGSCCRVSQISEIFPIIRTSAPRTMHPVCCVEDSLHLVQHRWRTAHEDLVPITGSCGGNELLDHVLSDKACTACPWSWGFIQAVLWVLLAMR
jgi:hypothetical protein